MNSLTLCEYNRRIRASHKEELMAMIEEERAREAHRQVSLYITLARDPVAYRGLFSLYVVVIFVMCGGHTASDERSYW